MFLRQKLDLPDKPISIVIWTTTPWTLPANLGVMASEDIEYVVVEEDNYLLLLEKQSQYVKNKEFIASLKGKELTGLEYQHPFIERTGKILSF